MSDTSIEDIMAALNKNGAVIQQSEIPGQIKEKKIPFGNLMLDVASNGGLPSGKIVRFIGHYSSGKSQVALRLFAHNQDRCHNCWEPKETHTCKKFVNFKLAYVDLENVYSPEWSSKNGIKITKENNPVYRVIPESGEHAVDIVDTLIRSRSVSVIIIDSLAAMVPSIELEKSVQDFVGGQVGAHAKIVNAAMRKWVHASLVSDSTTPPPLVICINQIRQTTNQYAPESTPGGLGQGFASVFDLRLERKKYMTDKGKIKGLSEFGQDAGEPVAQLVQYKIPKSRICSSGAIGEFWIWQKDDTSTGKKVGDIAYGSALYEYAVRYGAIKKVRKSYVVVDTGEEIGTTREELDTKLDNDRVLVETITQSIIKTINGKESRPS